MQGNGIINEIKNTFKQGGMLTKLVYINLGVFILVKILDAIVGLFAMESGNFLVEWLAVPAYLKQLLVRPWTVFSYMFLHQGFLHILFNMLWLFWMGKIFLEYLSGKQLLNLYLLGGLAGGAFYVMAFNVFPAFNSVLHYSYALGASASVLAIVVATAVYVPEYTVNLMFIGSVKLKYIALVSVLLDIVFLMDGNSGGHLAHIGGAAFGFLYAYQLKKGKDITKGFGRFLDTVFSLFTPKPKMKVSYKKGSKSDMDYNAQKFTEQQKIDDILEKIAKSGYDSLTRKEKEILFKQSRK